MPIVCGVRFRGIGKVYYFAPPEGEELTLDDFVIVETSRGRELGQIASPAHEVGDDEIVGDLKPILRRALSLDLLEMQRYCHQTGPALEQCRKEVEESGLPMKIVGAEYSYDGSRLTFFFTAEERVDFRELVRKLARSFKTRIELRQIGVRDEAKIVGGFGRCGRPLCCATWLSRFSPVSIRMAKQQDLPLSPMEISGVCGRLLCCLAYENGYYGQVKGKFPRVGRIIDSPVGRAKVIKVSVLKETVNLLLEDGSTVEMSAAQLAGEEPLEDKPLNTIQQRLDESSLGRSEARTGASSPQRSQSGGGASPREEEPAQRAPRRRSRRSSSTSPDSRQAERELEESESRQPSGRSRRSRRRPRSRPSRRGDASEGDGGSDASSSRPGPSSGREGDDRRPDRPQRTSRRRRSTGKGSSQS